MQDQHLTLAQGEARQCTFDIDSVCRRRARRLLWAVDEQDSDAATGLAHAVRQQTERHRPDPCLWVVVVAHLRPSRQKPYERLLHDFLGLEHRPRRGAQDTHEAPVRRGVQLLNGRQRQGRCCLHTLVTPTTKPKGSSEQQEPCPPQPLVGQRRDAGRVEQPAARAGRLDSDRVSAVLPPGGGGQDGPALYGYAGGGVRFAVQSTDARQQSCLLWTPGERRGP